MAIGSLAKGGACLVNEITDIEDIVVDRGVVMCPEHSFCFDLRTGKCVTQQPRPGTSPLRARCYDVVVARGGEVLLSRHPRGGGDPVVVENELSLEVGNKAQLHLVRRAIFGGKDRPSGRR